MRSDCTALFGVAMGFYFLAPAAGLLLEFVAGRSGQMQEVGIALGIVTIRPASPNRGSPFQSSLCLPWQDHHCA